MKKRQALILSVSLLVAGLVMLVSISFAWFASTMNVGTGGFDVKITAVADLDVKFMRKFSEEGSYTQVLPQSSFIGIDNEMIIPGDPVYCRIDITNNSVGAASVSTQFYNVAHLIGGTESAQNFIDGLKNDFCILFATDIVAIGAEPTEPTDDIFKANKLNFLNDIIGESTDGGLTFPQKSNTISLFSDISISGGSTLSFYYRYLLAADFKGFDGHTFSMTSGGILISG